MINIQNVVFDYDNYRALDNVSIHIEDNSITALVGPNGAGKTTLMRCIAGLLRPLSGDIFVNNIDVSKNPRQVQEQIGYLSDTFGLYDELSVERCLRYAAGLKKLPAKEINSAIDRVVSQLNLQDLVHKEAGVLSRGQRQRLAIAQCIIHQPKLLILDEPASGLDPEARFELAKLFKFLQSQNMTLLVSSHILAELDDYSTHILTIKNGKVLQHQSLNEAKNNFTLQIRFNDFAYYKETVMNYLRQLDFITHLQSFSDEVTCQTSKTEAQGAELLAYLVKQGIPITVFNYKQDNLQQSYIKAIEAVQ